jgi:DNA-binding MarR family transcriptional regulator
MVDIKRARTRNWLAKVLPDNDLPRTYTARHGFAEEDLRQAIELLFFAYRDMTAEPDEMLARTGLGRAHHRVIHFVGRNPGITVADLLAILRISKQSLARVLKDVVERGLVRQFRDDGDQRRRPLHLTGAGVVLETSLSAVQQKRLSRAFAAAGATAVDGWRTVLRALVEPADRERLERAAARRELFAKAADSLEAACVARTATRRKS